ncbi:MAG: carbon-nitrogen hydrolase family protein [Paracoccaceae bacterium]|nr:carbon-nitrogen hydrolase family protein [Paracoccaceae bacterium]
MKVALIQMTSGSDPDVNLAALSSYIREAAEQGADFVLTPEVSNCITTDVAQREITLVTQSDDQMLAVLQDTARDVGIWLSLGSLSLKSDTADPRLLNRSFLISPDGMIEAHYDKIHMFDAKVSETEAYRESRAYQPGARAVVSETPIGTMGLTICYDLRFPHLYRKLARAGAEILLVPSAFSPVTGVAHWESLLRARAIETGCFVLAAAQTGQNTPNRTTYGHSMAISPWGEVLCDAGIGTGITYVDLDLSKVAKARQRIPSLLSDADFEGP